MTKALLNARQLTTYELNHLLKFGVDPYKLDWSALWEIPVEYITHTAEFCGQSFYVDENVLIPRWESEKLVDMALTELDKLARGEKQLRVADIATGSGCIGISIGAKWSKVGVNLAITLSDISPAALKVAQKNAGSILANNHNITTEMIQSDLADELSGPYHLIVANLPYIPESRIAELQPSVRDYEPHLALDGGIEGLALIKKLIKQLRQGNILATDGALLLEVDDTHTQQVADELAAAVAGDKHRWQITVTADHAGKVRYWRCTLK